MKSFSDILMEELKKVFTSEKLQKLKEEMDNLNPSQKCVLCSKLTEKGHLLCSNCYARESMKMNEGRKNNE